MIPPPSPPSSCFTVFSVLKQDLSMPLQQPSKRKHYVTGLVENRNAHKYKGTLVPLDTKFYNSQQHFNIVARTREKEWNDLVILQETQEFPFLGDERSKHWLLLFQPDQARHTPTTLSSLVGIGRSVTVIEISIGRIFLDRLYFVHVPFVSMFKF